MLNRMRNFVGRCLVGMALLLIKVGLYIVPINKEYKTEVLINRARTALCDILGECWCTTELTDEDRREIKENLKGKGVKDG